MSLSTKLLSMLLIRAAVNAYRKLKLSITISEYSTTQRSLCGKEKRYSTQHTIPQNLNLKNILTKPSHFTGNQPFQHTNDDLRLILLVGEQKFWQLSMNCPAVGAPKSTHGYSGCLPPLRPYNPWHAVIVFQFPAALWAGGLVLHHHRPPSNLNQKILCRNILDNSYTIIYD